MKTMRPSAAQPQPRSAAFTPLHPPKHPGRGMLHWRSSTGSVKRRKRRAPMRPGYPAACEQYGALQCGGKHGAFTLKLRRLKGNLLFADGRVEERNNPGLAPANNQFPETAVLVLPSVLVPPLLKSPATPVPPGPAAASGAGQASPAGSAPIVATRPQGAATPPAWSTAGARAPGQALKTNLDRHAADRPTSRTHAKVEGQDLGTLPPAQRLGSVATEPATQNSWAAYLLLWMLLAALVGLALRQRLRATGKRATRSRR